MTNRMASARQTAELDIDTIRADFPILSRQVNDKPLVYLDSAASAQKPNQVIEALVSAYQDTYSNVHRGLHFLSEASTDAYEAVRGKVAGFIGAASGDEIVLTAGATMSLNLIAQSWAAPRLQAGDEILISIAEHHANIVPWQLLREAIGIELKVIPIDDAGNLMMDKFEELLSPRTRLVSVTHISNVLGTVLPVKEIIRLAHAHDARVLIDGAQGIMHSRVDVQDLDVDFYGFTGHKLYGPSGIGVLYGKRDILNSMPPYEGGGDMIDRVTFEKTTYRETPARFEAGTPAIVEAAGLAAAVEYVESIGIERIAAHEQSLLDYATARLSGIEGLRIYGEAEDKAGVVSFTIEGVHPHDISTIIDSHGVAVRAGHHCAQPLMDRFDLAATARASLGMYNNKSDIDQLVEALEFAKDIFS